MNLKKMIAVAVAVATLAASSTIAFAHHGGGGCGRHSYYYGNQTTTSSQQTVAPSQSTVPATQDTVTYQVCAFEGCTIADVHTHADGCYYYGHYAGDGHVHHSRGICGTYHNHAC